MAVQAVFLVCGFGISSWAPMVPFVRDSLNLNEAEVGLLLLFLGAGALISMPAAGWVIVKQGSKKVIGISTLLVSLSLPVILLMPNSQLTALMLFILGIGIGGVDVAMNTQAVLVEKKTDKPVMSSLHGLYSVGGLLGPLFIALLLGIGYTPLTAVLCSAVLLLLILGLSFRNLISFSSEKRERLSAETENKKGNFSQINGSILFLGFMCFTVFLSEGAMLDWSAIFLRDIKNTDGALSGLGYACFSFAMALMRLVGDKLVSKMGNKKIVVLGSLIGAIGIISIIISPWMILSFFGFILLGLGVANIVPVFFSEAGKMNNAIAIPAITTIGYAGQLIGPALLGVIAQKISLNVAFYFIAFLLFIVAVSYNSAKNA